MTAIKDWIAANVVLILAGLAALFAFGLTVQTVRLDGFRVDPPLLPAFGPEGWIAKAKRLEAQNLAILAAQDKAEELHLLEVARKEGEYQQKAQETDRVQAQLQDAQLALARRFIAAGGVRPQANRGGAVSPAANTESSGAGDGDRAGGVPLVDGLQLVSVYARDVEVCTINTSRLRAAQQWGVDLAAR